MHVGAPPVHRKHPTSFHACTERGFSIKLFSGLTSKYSASFPESLILSWSQGACTCMRTSLRFEVVRGEHGCMALCHLHTWLASHADLPLQGEVLVWWCFRHSNTRCILSLFPSRAWVASWIGFLGGFGATDPSGGELERGRPAGGGGGWSARLGRKVGTLVRGLW